MKIQFRFFIRLLLILPCLFLSFITHATHQRAAEIIYRHISELTYEITLISYTFTPSPANAYRDYLLINWGDGTADEIPRIEKRNLGNDITYNRYVGQHTFPGPSTYVISCEDPNRNMGILNIPNSVNIPLFIFSELVINPFLEGYNNSPVLLLPPIDNGCVDQPYYHNPGAYDIDGDSLSYRLVPCSGAQGLPIPGYTLPPASNIFNLNSITGDLIWDSPPQQGEYNIAILIEEWRNGVKIGSVLRDMQIIIIACDNKPPVIEPIADTCIEAGKTLTFDVHAYDTIIDVVTLTGTGGPLVLTNHPATLDPDPASGQGHAMTTFEWITVCDHVLRKPYKVFFKASDNGSPVSLVDINSMNILVVGPAPTNLTAEPLGNSITLNWDNYTCPNASGYYVFRKADSTGYIPGYCQTGVPPYLGYEKIDELDNLTTTTYTDNNHGAGLNQGIKYCYLLVAWYPDRAESYASNEACAILKKDLPVITNVSINTTDETNGSLYLAWSKPTEIDTLQAPGPYMYVIERALPGLPEQFIPIDTLYDLNDTIYTDTLLNTKNFPQLYKIDLHNLTPGNKFFIGSSQVASSIFLSIAPTDKELKLTWTNNVPWNNNLFVIYRKDQGTSSFDSVGFSEELYYNDAGLVNGQEYCYLLKSIGNYSAGGFVDPIINYSQITCEIPIDNVPPCPPIIHDSTDCLTGENIISWTNPGYDSCTKDIVKYLLYYSSCNTSELSILDSLFGIDDTLYIHQNALTIAGCYAVVAIDSVGNRSIFSDTACITIDRCGIYSLPNVFTPNGDDFNEIFKPMKYSSVDHIEINIFSRWGRKVFTTMDPDINWNGNDMTTDQPCSDGVYFYICDVYEYDLCGLNKRTLHGTVTILR